MTTSDERRFAVHDKVRKISGYEFDSTVVSVFNKVDGQVRLVCEDDRGLLHIFNQDQMERIPEPTDPAFIINEATHLIRHALAGIDVGSVDARAAASGSLSTAGIMLEKAREQLFKDKDLT